MNNSTDKTYKLVEHAEPLKADEIKRLYNGHWVFVVKAKVGDYGELLSGIPVVIGAMSADGVEDGIYEKYRSEEYEERFHLNLLPHRGFIPFLRIAGEQGA